MTASETMTPEIESDITDKRRWYALYVLCAGFLMIVLDMTVVNVALPYIQDDLEFTTSSLAWVVNAYLIAFGGLLLLSGRIGDLLGRRDVFLTGLALFTAASIACGLAQTQTMLLGARFVQGIGGALSSAVILGMIFTLFPQPRDMAKALGIYAFVASSGGAIGLLIGGLLTEALSWHWIFFVNVPIGVATAFLATRLLDRDRGLGLREGADIPGAVLVTSGLMLLVYTIVKPAAEEGWTATSTLVFGAISICLLAAFVVRQATAAKPLMALHILRSRNVSGANLIQVVSIAGMFGVFFLGSLYMQRVLNFDAMKIGLAFMPVTVLMAVLSVRYSDRLIMKFGARRVLVPSLALMAFATLLFVRVPVDGSYVTDLLPTMVLFGIGSGLCFPSLMNLAMSGATESDAGLVSGLVNTTAQVGAALGLAVLATLSTSKTNELTTSGATTADALVGGYHLAFWVGGGLLVVGLLIALVVLETPKTQQPQH